MRFPISCFDDFYTDPDRVREWALGLEYVKHKGTYPGLRTQCLSTIDPNFYNISCRKFLSMFDDFDKPPEEIEYTIKTYFQKIWRFSPDPDSIRNKGWIHRDTNVLLAGVVYLNPNSDPDAGTSIYTKKKDAIIPEWMIYEEGVPNKSQFVQDILQSNFSCPIDSIKDYDKGLKENNDMYELTLEIKNKYNRMIAYDGDQWHGQSTYWMDNEDCRLTQVYFVEQLNCIKQKLPHVRCERYGI
tara:strand:- start:235 stop:960 length:726 start_codon:yes stop_codon:yes gene_type:complete